MSDTVSIVLVGIGGYGNNYVRGLLENPKRFEYDFNIVGVVDPNPCGARMIDKIRELKIPIFSTLEEFYENNSADLAVISTPIQFHSIQTCLALSKGSNVLCEKPLSSTPREALKMIECRDKFGKFVSIGYQWSHNRAIHELKEDIMSGIFGKPVRLKTLVQWARTDTYFKRGWAGKLKDSEGRPINDSIANNATAHYIHNMFYILGDRVDTSIRPATVTAELYRANKIENYDTAMMRTITENGVEIMYFGTHATKKHYGPVFRYEFEKAAIEFEEKGDRDSSIITANFNDGSTKAYTTNPFNDTLVKLWNAILAVKGKAKILCPPEAALSHTLCIQGMQDSKPQITNFPEEMVKWTEDLRDGHSGTYAKGLDEAIERCYENWALPSELGVPWACPGKEIQIAKK